MTEWIEITTEEGADGEATERVPKAWYEHLQRAERVREELQERYRDIEGVTGTSLAKGERTIEGRHVSQPVVYAAGEIASEIPDEVDGVPVRVEPPRGEFVLD